MAQEADTNGDRRADVWVRFENGERAEQFEDQKYQGKVTARYVLKNGAVAQQEQLDNAEPPRLSEPFGAVERALPRHGRAGEPRRQRLVRGRVSR